MWRRYRPFETGEFIVVGVDTAAGGGDFCAAQFLSKTRLDVPLVYHEQQLASDMTPQLHVELETIFSVTGEPPVIAYERNNGGVFEIERLAQLNKNGNYIIYQARSNMATTGGMLESPKLGWDTNTATRPAMLAELKDGVDKNKITIYDHPTLNEMFSFVVVRTSSAWKAQAEVGAHDDLVMSLAIAWQLYQTELPQAKQVRNIVYQKQPGEPNYTPYVGNADGTISGVGLDIEKIVRQGAQSPDDWKYR
jgi:hypothetical protein